MILDFICSFAVAASLGVCAPPSTRVVGYVEGEYVRIGPIDTARIESVAVRRGERVAPGALLAELQADDARNAVAESEARLVQAQAQLANLLSGKRPEEIAVIEAVAASAKAQERESERALERRQDLFRRGVSTQADLDQAQTARDVATSRVRETVANLNVARLAAREEEIKAARNQVAQAQAALDQAKWRHGQRKLTAPAAGIVTDLIRHPGELAGPSAPALTILPDGAVKLMLYVPEALLFGTTVGTRLDVRCSGCPQGLAATVSYVSQEPEFTPPVIYSAETRQKLVYLVEARPEGGPATRLQPGQIVDVMLRGRR
ncbi:MULTISPECIES: HlyD family efflux transporter periplasmic adaptor subunit [unclassified Bosea (in: a-proteobacteria)]|uniref:HlyD family secretion protein n=1 Tax=unclassified Bosea (in: a-proteobacteria) TaxID=2653178 RepID=UPI000F753BBD|nr:MULTISPECIES: HlyD family efflux transporter periplasmic adaptor subunit [unclassified Bosea (in: a-proteobacteria)]AZO76621.1 HlyD family secretion protein [Bosea sp. Tri-49]RXT21453.1 HlyD family secretion protein [Bosea sp. Tri-39]RXT31792.1 HlyD family secretion protein [Bosea sp. Tri-54]